MLKLPNAFREASCAQCIRSQLRRASTARTSKLLTSRDAGPSRSIIFTSPIYAVDDYDASVPRTNGANVSIRRRRRYLESLESTTQSSDTHPAGLTDDHDPWIKMTRSPERSCIVTRHKLPSSFLINLRPTDCTPRSTPEAQPRPSLYLFPDRVDQPTRLKRGRGFWVSCHRTTIERLSREKGPHLGALRQIPGIQVPPNLSEIIESQLRSRVMYELERLARRLRTRTLRVGTLLKQNENRIAARRFENHSSLEDKVPAEKLGLNGNNNAEGPVLRMLDEERARMVVRGDGTTMLSVDKDIGEDALGGPIALLDLSNLVPSSESGANFISAETADLLPLVSSREGSTASIREVPIGSSSDIADNGNAPSFQRVIPLYNLAALFPTSFHADLDRGVRSILDIERTYAHRHRLVRSHLSVPRPPIERTVDDSMNSDSSTEREDRPPRVLVLSSYPAVGEPTSNRSIGGEEGHNTPREDDGTGSKDTVPNDRGSLGVDLAIALWRLRCFYGSGWEKVQ